MTPPRVDIAVRHRQWRRAFPAIGEAARAVTVLTFEKTGINGTGRELSIVLADNGFVQKLNRQWRGKDRPTNVLAFPQNEPARTPGGCMMLGDIILAYETVRDEARAANRRFADHATHLIAHGLLHLLGHDHAEQADAAIMESLEIAILAALEIKNPYAADDSVA